MAGEFTPEAWQGLKLRAQESILEFADERWAKGYELTPEVRLLNLARVASGGPVRLAHIMARAAIDKADRWASGPSPTQPQWDFSNELADLGWLQRIRLYTDVFSDCLVRVNRQGTVLDVSQLSSHLFPRTRMDGASEQSTYINVFSAGTFGRAAIIVSLMHLGSAKPYRNRHPGIVTDGDRLVIQRCWDRGRNS